MRKHYRRPYTIKEQAEFNEKCAENINAYWKELGYDAAAHVEKLLVEVPNAGKEGNQTRKMWSEEIVSSVPTFPSVKKQVLGIVD
jgi:hypothetical protein